jgi:MFS family permease
MSSSQTAAVASSPAPTAPRAPDRDPIALDARSRSRGLAVVFAATFLDLVGWFMLVPLLAVQLVERGHGPAFVGLFGALPWIGILVATPFVSRFVVRHGRGAALWVSGLVPLGCALGLLATDDLRAWFVLWFVGGLASALRWIVAEATVAELAPPARRGRWVGLFETMVGATFVVGPAVLLVTGTEGRLPFAASAAFVAAGVAALLALPTLAPEPAADGRVLGLRGVWGALRALPVVMTVGFVGGFFESGLSSVLPVWGLSIGWTAALAAMLVAASGAGSAVAMVPVGEAADRLGRRPVAIGCAAVVLASTLLVPATGALPWLAWPLAIAWGGAGGALYTIAMVDLGARLRGLELMNATAVLILAYTAGGVVAPIVGGAALQFAPTAGFPLLLAAVAATGLAALLRATPWRRIRSAPVRPRRAAARTAAARRRPA